MFAFTKLLQQSHLVNDFVALVSSLWIGVESGTPSDRPMGLINAASDPSRNHIFLVVSFGF
jgi:hypothetical protein